ncbi:hypothetical protein TNCV_1983221 [Trichonephila clavipes]|nr:hypothetical protein TNCV_1983221 [Trichonephila clavipes]
MSTCAGNHWRKQTSSNACNLNRREQISSLFHEPPFRIAWRSAFESQKLTRHLAYSRIRRVSYSSRASPKLKSEARGNGTSTDCSLVVFITWSGHKYTPEPPFQNVSVEEPFV